jgi:hypothetical protein
VREHAKAPTVGSALGATVSALLLALAFLAATSVPASAAASRPLLRTIFVGAESNPQSLATDSAGDLYVYENSGTPGVEKFDAAGNPVAFSASGSYIDGNELTGAPTKAFESTGFPPGLAVDESGGPTDGYIYVGTEGQSAGDFLGGAYVFDSTGAYKGFIGPHAGEANPPVARVCGIGLDQLNGDIYLSGFDSSSIVRYTPHDGNPANDTISGKLNVGPESHECVTAIDSTGAIYTSGAYYSSEGNYYGPVTKYPSSQLNAEPSLGTEFDPHSASGLALDPATDDIFIDAGNQIVQRTAAGALVSAFGAPTDSRGIALGEGGDVYVSDTSGTVSLFGPVAQLPAVKTGASSGVAQDLATVEGEVDPDSAGGVTKCEFKYGSDSSYSQGSAPCSPEATGGSPIGSATPVSAELTGLVANHTYHYRLYAANANGVQVGVDQSFTTPQAVEGVTTGEATPVTKDAATLTGSFIGNGKDTHYYFEYGTEPSYGQTAPAPPGNDAGSSSGQQEVAPVQITGLQGGTTYHYRLVASSSFGESRGEDLTFTTAPAVSGLSTDPVSGTSNEATDLHGSFDGDERDTHYYFELGPTAAYGRTAPAPPGNDAGAGSGRITVAPVHVEGLQQGATYHYRIVASNGVGKTFGPDATFRTAEQPSVTNLSTANVTASSAELTAEINPQQGETHYRFEWGPTTAYGNSAPVPDGDAGSGSSQVQVAAQLDGLTSGTIYHFRLVAENAYGTTTSGDQSFGFYPPACPNSQARQETGSNDLPDCRAYELTTPSDAQGTTIFPLNGPNTGLATNPSRVSYGGAFGSLPDTGDPMNSVNDLYVSTRTDTGWYAKYIGRAGNESLLMGGPPEGLIANIFQGQNPAVSQFGAQASPSMDRFLNYDLGNPSAVYGQLGEPSNAPYVWSASTGAFLERWPTNLSSVAGGKDFVGTPKTSLDFNHFVFSANVAFAPGGEEFGGAISCCGQVGFHEVFEGMCCSAPVYDNDISTGQVSLVSIKEDGSAFRGAPVHVSDDGSRILMSETNDVPAGLSRPLFLRVADERTYDIAGGRPVHYAGSTADGKTVYLTSPEQLTADDHDSSVDLFVWKEGDPHSLTRVSVGSGGAAGNNDSCSVPWVTNCGVGLISLERFYGARGGTSGQETGNGTSDGPLASKSGDLYFESPEQLDGPRGEQGQVNLYLYREGTVRYVTTMGTALTCGEENANFEVCSEGPAARMEVTPSGDHMAFVTASRLTSYDNAGHGEMYSYSPASGRVICVSCRPDGRPAKSNAYGSQNGLFLTNDGRVFFSTRDPLVPRDTDGINDVYEYVEGKPQLISSGLGVSTEGFTGFNGSQTTPGLDSVSANGTDVYFATYDSLVTQDHNGQVIKIYDARTGGGFPAETAPPNCAAADECHGAGSVPPAAAPDRTSAGLGSTHVKHKRHTKHKKRGKAHGKAKKRPGKSSHKKQGRHDRG